MVSRADALPDAIVERIHALHAEELPSGKRRGAAEIARELKSEMGITLPRQTVHRYLQRAALERFDAKRTTVREAVADHADANVRELQKLAAEATAAWRTGRLPGTVAGKAQKLSPGQRVDMFGRASKVLFGLVDLLGLDQGAADVDAAAARAHEIYGWDEGDGDEADDVHASGNGRAPH